MRTIKLTDEQISLLKQAIGIAELRFDDIHAEILKKTIIVRGIDCGLEQGNHAKYYYDKACTFADLNILLENGDLDV